MSAAQSPATLSTTPYPSPVGTLKLVASDAGLRAILWPDDRPGRVRFGEALQEDADHPVLRRAARQLDEYFAGERRRFDLPMDPAGTEFQILVWKALCGIPYGKTWTYGEVAACLFRPDAARAVGAAVGRNPVSIVVPCHRVVGKDGKLTGFAGGLDVKRKLLTLEGLNRVHDGAQDPEEQRWLDASRAALRAFNRGSAEE